MQNLGIDNILKSFPRLLDGIAVTLKISLIALVLSIILGLILGIAMTSRSKVLLGVLRTFLEAFRLIHPLIWLFVFFFGSANIFHIQIDNVAVSILVFTLWGAFEIGDLVRSFITSLPRSQYESSMALGLSKIQMYIFVLLPQIIARTTPSIVNLATRLIKTTTLVYLIGVPEVLKVSQSIIQVTYLRNPNSYISFTMYLFLLIVYFIICYPLSLFEKYLEKKVLA
ncbi:polar amino acid transport system permease protein [Sporobacter termitidis DSM 10068]|uniref:Polar amino acid transport system permease protein n=1 Tax=Sporobacter termitidis DSM 10068 TaxID=1123282 RepID=A0A1M5ZED6_9FIRM|nr:amino acid ABC transporter permease [Sporobacter termitidis]SHI22587.1 polar amino acid transport system permease protein [Sporobacter termitidis DSM 10068]